MRNELKKLKNFARLVAHYNFDSDSTYTVSYIFMKNFLNKFGNLIANKIKQLTGESFIIIDGHNKDTLALAGKDYVNEYSDVPYINSNYENNNDGTLIFSYEDADKDPLYVVITDREVYTDEKIGWCFEVFNGNGEIKRVFCFDIPNFLQKAYAIKNEENDFTLSNSDDLHDFCEHFWKAMKAMLEFVFTTKLEDQAVVKKLLDEIADVMWKEAKDKNYPPILQNIRDLICTSPNDY